MSRDRFVIILFIVALLSGLFWSYEMFGQPIIYGDGVQYNILAKNILEHSIYSSAKNDLFAFSEPFYPIFLAGNYFLFGVENFDAVRIVQLFLFAFTVLIIYLLAKELLKKKAAIFIGLLVVLFFPLANMVGSFLRETLFTFLLVFLIYALYRAQKTLNLKWFIFAGLAFGLATLTNAVVQFFVIFIVLNFLFVFKKNFFQRYFLAKTGIFLFFCLIPVAAWTLGGLAGNNIRSLDIKSGGTLSRKAEMMESMQGEKYLRHLGGQLFGYYFFEKEGFEPYQLLGHPQTTKRIEEMLKSGYSAEEVSKILTRERSIAIVRNIPQYFAVSFLDFLQFNGPMLPNPGNLAPAPMQNLFIKGSHPEIPAFLKVIILLILRILYWFFFGFVIYGLIKAVKDWRRFGWIILVILYFNLAYSALLGIPRYAIPIYPFYITFFVYGLFYLSRRLKLINIEAHYE